MAPATEPSLDPLERWLSQDDSRNLFNPQLSAQESIIIDFPDHCQRPYHRSASRQTSTIVHPVSEYDGSMASDRVPALTRGNSIASMSSAASTGMASMLYNGCAEPEDGVVGALPILYRTEDLLCPFEVLGCSQLFSDVREFKTHVFSHFRGHQLPTFAPCFGCGHPFFQRPEDDNALAWNDMLSHMTHDHYRSGQTEITLKPDAAIMRYMWNRKIISNAEFIKSQDAPEARPLIPNRQQVNMERMPELPVAPSVSAPSRIQEYHRNNRGGRQNAAVTIYTSRRRDRRHPPSNEARPPPRDERNHSRL